jgi:hypothetical protein
MIKQTYRKVYYDNQTIKTAGGKSFTIYKEMSGRASILKFPTYKALVERMAIMDPNFIKIQEKVSVGTVTKETLIKPAQQNIIPK